MVTPSRPFTKMHGAGNDFVVLDLRDAEAPSPACCRALSDRHRGVGCDMILGIDVARTSDAVASFRIWTSDGASSQQCGNGIRCVAAWLFRAGIAKARCFRIDSPSGTHAVSLLDDGRVRVALAIPDFRRHALALDGFSSQKALSEIEAPNGAMLQFTTVSMGNPHAVIEVDDIDTAPVAPLGRAMQRSGHLPSTVNVGFAQIVSRAHIRLRVFEFGAGETLACGSGACAAAAVLMRRGLINPDVTVTLSGGDLQIAWPSPYDPVLMTGPAAFVFQGWL